MGRPSGLPYTPEGTQVAVGGDEGVPLLFDGRGQTRKSQRPNEESFHEEAVTTTAR